MHQQVIAFNKTQQKTEFQKFRSGDVIKIYRNIIEGAKKRVQMYEGMIIAINARQSSSPTLTVRKISANNIGVEIIIPLYSPTITKIELIKRAQVRRSKLYHVRNKSTRSLRFKFTDAKNLLTAPPRLKNKEVKDVEAIDAKNDTITPSDKTKAKTKKEEKEPVTENTKQ